MAYNIAGLKGKSINPDFISYINNFDVILLFETYVEERDFDKFKKVFSNFKLIWIAAHRSVNIGRASGGCLYGIRETLLN